jgi:hypothetical protein
MALAWVLSAVIALGVYATYTTFTSRFPGANDFFSRWVGGCALLCEGENPYSQAVTRRIQMGMYGRPAMPTEDQVAFAYPLYSLFFFFPLCLVQEYAWVQAIWLWFLLVVLLAAIILWMRVIEWHPHRCLWVVTLLWTMFMYHSFRALILGQFSLVVLLALVLAIGSLKQGCDGWAGFFLALATVKPQLIYLAIPWILFWAAGQRRWRLWSSFGLSMVALVAFPMILEPLWVPDFVRQVLNYPSYTVYGSLTWMIFQYGLNLGRGVELAISVILAVGGLAVVWRYRHGTWEQMLWTLGVLLLLTNFFTPRIATTNYVLLIPYALWGFMCIQSRWKQGGPWVVIAFEILSLAGLWILFLATIQGNFEQVPAYLPFPLVMALLLLFLWKSAVHQPSSSHRTRVEPD